MDQTKIVQKSDSTVEFLFVFFFYFENRNKNETKVLFYY